LSEVRHAACARLSRSGNGRPGAHLRLRMRIVRPPVRGHTRDQRGRSAPVSGMRRARRAGVRPAHDPLQGDGLGKVGSPGDERAHAARRKRVPVSGVGETFVGRSVPVAVGHVGREPRSGGVSHGERVEAGRVRPIRARQLRPR
jgi:hypothetical protein